MQTKELLIYSILIEKIAYLRTKSYVLYCTSMDNPYIKF